MWYRHAFALAKYFQKHRLKKGRKSSLASTPEFDELLKNCAWYLVEIGEHEECLSLLDICFSACLDQKGLLYSQLCNTAMTVHFEANNLTECAKYRSKCMEIRTALLDPDGDDLGNLYNNYANELMSQGKLDESLEMHLKSEAIKMRNPNTIPQYLALAKLGLGRVHYLKRDFKKSSEYYEEARKLAVSVAEEGKWVIAM